MRWTRVAKDIVPKDLNFFSNDSAPVQNLTYRNMLLDLDAARILTEGYFDADTSETATKHMNQEFMEVGEYKILKEPGEVSESETRDDASCSGYASCTIRIANQVEHVWFCKL